MGSEMCIRDRDKAGYTGWVGCEYRPAGRTEDGLGWFAAHRGSQRPGERA